MLSVDLPTRAEITKLIGYRGSPSVSIYLRTTPVTQDAQADRIELKNLLKSATTEMVQAGTPKRSIESIQLEVEALIEDDEFWAHQANSLAIFVDPESIRTFRLPNHLTNLVEVSDRYHLKPLFRAVTFPHHAYLLPIGMGAVRLVEMTADLPPQEIKVADLPQGAADAAGRRSHIERKGNMSSGESTSENALLTRYARTVDQALRPILAGHERPLILVAAEPMASIFRSVCSYPHLAREVISHSADHTADHELAAGARRVLDGIYATELSALGEVYEKRKGQGRATADVALAARAATFGAVDTLIVDMDADVPGSISEDDGKVTFAEQADGKNYSVTDEIARRAWTSGAKIVAARRADIPDGGVIAAILRYPF